MDIKFEKAIVLKQIIESIKDLVTDSIIDFTKDGIILQAMDSGHVSLCSLYLNYKCKENISIGISLVNIGLILKCAKNDDSVILRVNNSDTCKFIFESQDKISEFEFKLMNIDSEKYGIPDIEYKCILELDSKVFKSIITDMTNIEADTCKISVIKNNIIFSATSSIGSITIKQKCVCDKEISDLSFSVKYLLNFTKATILCDHVKLYIHNEYPLCIEYTIKDLGFLKYYLAPKLDDIL